MQLNLTYPSENAQLFVSALQCFLIHIMNILIHSNTHLISRVERLIYSVVFTSG